MPELLVILGVGVRAVLLLLLKSAMERRRQPTCTIARLTIMNGEPYAEIIPV